MDSLICLLFSCRCLQCHANCSSCFGGDRDQCLKCVDGLHFFNNSCVEECPHGMFVDKTGLCQLCSLVCDGGCVRVATNCTTCKGEDLPYICFETVADLQQTQA